MNSKVILHRYNDPCVKNDSKLLFFNIAQSEYNVDLTNNLNDNFKKHHIYIDDILCTGNKFYNNIDYWSGLTEYNINNYRDGLISNLSLLNDGTIDLIAIFLFCHSKNFNNKINKYRYNGCSVISEKIILRSNKIINKTEKYFTINLHDLNQQQPYNDLLNHYILYLTLLSNSIRTKKGWELSKSDFINRNTKIKLLYENKYSEVEQIIFNKGFEILLSKALIPSVYRPLGYSLSTDKSFGFGNLCFTWYNVPICSPLIFWMPTTNESKRSKKYVPFFRTHYSEKHYCFGVWESNNDYREDMDDDYNDSDENDEVEIIEESFSNEYFEIASSRHLLYHIRNHENESIYSQYLNPHEYKYVE